MASLEMHLTKPQYPGFQSAEKLKSLAFAFHRFLTSPTLSRHECSIVFRRVDSNCAMLNNSNLNRGTRFQCPKLFQLL